MSMWFFDSFLSGNNRVLKNARVGARPTVQIGLLELCALHGFRKQPSLCIAHLVGAQEVQLCRGLDTLSDKCQP